MQVKVDQILQVALDDIGQSKDSQQLYDVKVKYLGKQGQLSLLMRDMGKLRKRRASQIWCPL